jgi:hypothetical protein
MRNVATNGFGCPYCRAVMAEEPEEDEETVYTDFEEEEEDDDVMRGFRLFWNNINNQENEQEDIDEEEEYVEEEQVEELNQDQNAPNTQYVADKLKEQGITFEKLIDMICNLDHDEYHNDEQADRFSDELFGKIRIIVSNYNPQQQTQINPVPVPVIDSSAQPKTPLRMMRLHV